MGGSAVSFSLTGCLSSAEESPDLPVFGYNAGRSEHTVRIMISGPDGESIEGLPRENRYTLEPNTTRKIETVNRRDVDLHLFFEDSGMRGSTDTIEVRSGTETVSENGYLAVVRDEPIGGEYVHLNQLPEDPE